MANENLGVVNVSLKYKSESQYRHQPDANVAIPALVAKPAPLIPC